MDGFAVGTPQMRQAAQDMSSARDVLVKESNTLREECTAIQPAWKGSAGTAFQHLMTRYDDGFKKLMQSLQGIEEQLLGAARDVDAQQEADNQSLSQITNALGG